MRLIVFLLAISCAATELWDRGYSVIPTPRNVQLSSGDVVLDSSWRIDGPKGIALRSLTGDLDSLHALKLNGAGPKVIRLSVAPAAVRTGAEPGIDKQAYRVRIDDNAIEVTGNSDAGLFYGVQTLIQLPKRDPAGRLLLPKAVIEDWPRLQLRFLHWDTKHHQDRIETLKRYIDWAARFKVNMIGFELEDKFEYPSHPVIGAPGAFTTRELQEIVNYGLERYIQVVPQIQGPAHMAYVLKHPEFRELRADGNNYQSDVCNPKLYDLVYSMYDDVIKATQGVDYVFISTDEVYYAGIDGMCTKPYNPENRSLAWVGFVQKAHDYLQKRGRKMLIWAEFPLLPEHVKLLPEGIIDGIVGDAAFIPIEKQRNIRQLAYASMQGAEFLVPSFFTLPDEPRAQGNLEAAYNEFINGRAMQGNPIGAFGAAWDDSGLHNETFWLGWSTVAQYAWTPGTPPLNQHVAEFMNLYYGPRVTGMVEIYRTLEKQARAWERTWEYVPSKITYRYGGYFGKGLSTHRTDMTLRTPYINDLPDWFPDPQWSERYKEWIAEAKIRAAENAQLQEAVQANFAKADRNQYNLEVLMALTRFIGHHWQMLLDLEKAEALLKEGQNLAIQNRHADAVNTLAAAYKTVRGIQKDCDATYGQLEAVFEKSRYPKGRSVGGREFVHVIDDVKDHWADRRADLSYMIAPEQNIGFDAWLAELEKVIQLYSKYNNVPAPELGK